MRAEYLCPIRGMIGYASTGSLQGESSKKIVDQGIMIARFLKGHIFLLLLYNYISIPNTLVFMTIWLAEYH